MLMGTGFYDKSIKNLMQKCQRLVVIAINSIFNRSYDENAVVTFLDKEMVGDKETESTYMDMLVEIKDGIETGKFHWEFQLQEGSLISIRVYEYATRETLRAARENLEDVEEYELYVKMPEQVVVFLSGANKKDRIKVTLCLPDLQEVTYTLPCISAAVSIDRLIEDKLYLFIPYQQVQLNDRMNCIKDKTIKIKQKIAKEIKTYQVQVKTALENLKNNGTITSIEYEALIETFANVEQYLRKKDMEVDKVVKDMGDENYIPWSERVRAEARAQGLAEGRAEGRAEMEEMEEMLAEQAGQLAEQYERIRELERQLEELKKADA
jgi:hypothetical protein